MSYHIQSSFAAGELDPALHERTTFDKYQSGLATLRNTVIGKTGRPISRPGTKYSKGVKGDSLGGEYIVDATADLFTKKNHGFCTGTRIRFYASATQPTGITTGVDYYAIFVSVDSFRIASTIANAVAGTYINITSGGLGYLKVLPFDGYINRHYTANAGTEIFTVDNHGYSLGTRVRVMTTNTVPAGLAVNTTYYVIPIDSGTFYLATTLANALSSTNLGITTTGTGIQLIYQFYAGLSGIYTYNSATDLFTLPNHGFETGSILQLQTTDTVPQGFLVNKIYYVVKVDGDNFRLALTQADAAAGTYIGIAADGAGVQSLTSQEFISKESVIYAPPYSGKMIEWGHNYVRVHDIVTSNYTEDYHDFAEADIPYLQFVRNGLFVYIFRVGKGLKKMVLGDLDPLNPLLDERFVAEGEGEMFKVPNTLSWSSTNVANTGAGYDVVYLFIPIEKGEEGPGVFGFSKFGYQIPIAAGQVNSLDINVTTTLLEAVKVYRRPKAGREFGFIGFAVPNGTSGADYIWRFSDFGAEADFTNTPVTYDPFVSDLIAKFPSTLEPRTGVVYQQRLLMTESANEEAIHASRTGFQNNFLQDHPISSDSALTLKAGTSGNAKVLRMIDEEGLIVFTTIGIYQSLGGLAPSNLSLDRKGNWVIDEKIPPLQIPGGVLFVDKATNTIRTLIFSQEAGGFPGDEISIFSNHLFQNKHIVSWDFQDGKLPLVCVVMNDGTMNVLTYQREHQMRAWSRHDTDGFFLCTTTVKDLNAVSNSYFIIKRGTKRFIEILQDRSIPAIRDMALLDSSVTYHNEFASNGTRLFPVTPDDWEGTLTLIAENVTFSAGLVGSTFRVFGSDSVDLVVTSFVSASEITVLPSIEVPVDLRQTDIALFLTTDTIKGLDHLEGKSVSVLSDGFVIASPNNNIKNYDSIIVQNGQITLPDPGAVVHVGLPFTCDIETLDIDTVEQKPELLESIVVSKLYLKVFNSRGLFAGSNFPTDNKIAGMESLEDRIELTESAINLAQVPYTERIELALENSWKSHGRICIRQVDPLPFEILSIIPDLRLYDNSRLP